MSLIDFYLIEKKFKRNIIDDIINIYLKNHLTKIDVHFQTEPKHKKKASSPNRSGLPAGVGVGRGGD